MKLKSLLFSLVAVATLSSPVFAQAPAPTPVAGQDYSAYDPQQPTDAGPGKIEVTEFFFYDCPHCNDMEPLIEQWAKTLPKDVVLRRVPVLFRPQLAAGAKLYYTLDAMNLVGKLNADVFNAIHQQNINLDDQDTLFKWIASKGVDATKFAQIYGSFAVDSKVRNADQITRAHKIPGTPAIVVDGKYLVASGDHARELQIASYLIEKVRASKKK
ncbi:MAG TPA: thiol:disulfide interchange protein DsbA/DsbL [Rhodocyclaceae bacterium]|nr:thiol:disulfide interchange protein DsbA/DsbL [Rhodocyclaceae bacterium]